MKKFFNDFKEFAMRGNVLNLAVGVIIGAAFQSVVTSLTENVLSPVIGLLTGGNFDALEFSALGITLRYGAFITSVVNFVIMAFVVFLIVRLFTKLTTVSKKKTPAKEAAAPTQKDCPYCKTSVHIAATRCPACTSELKK